jgi:putative Mg2+ transporter-C (MgtC) family protein
LAKYRDGTVFLTLVLFGHIERRYLVNKYQQRLKVTISDQPGQLGRIGSFFGQYGISIHSVIMQHQQDHNNVDVELILRVPPNTELVQIIQKLIEVQGVHAVDKLK